VRAVITNDDGIDSPGLAVLARAAESAGLGVVVAAPSWDSSGASASLTAVEENGRFLFTDATVDGVRGRCYAMEAAPAFIARAATHGAFGDPPDLLLSGVNLGLNCGHAVLHSGTVGAASTAYTFGIPAIAFSIDGAEDSNWDTAGIVIRAVLGWSRRHLSHTLLNVNVPDVPAEALRGLRPATLAPFGAVTANVTEVGSGYVTMQYRAPEDANAGPDSDVALVAGGFATFTLLSPVCEAGGIPPAELVDAVGGD
jgi:5'-nucleotidase